MVPQANQTGCHQGGGNYSPIRPPTAPGGADQTTATARREWRPERRNSHGSGKASYNLGSQGLCGAHQGKQGSYSAQ